VTFYIGGVYDLGDGTRLHDVQRHCWTCGKRLAEVVHDPAGCWRHGDFVCIDCGETYAPARVLAS
jgi:hypothetical protein